MPSTGRVRSWRAAIGARPHSDRQPPDRQPPNRQPPDRQPPNRQPPDRQPRNRQPSERRHPDHRPRRVRQQPEPQPGAVGRSRAGNPRRAADAAVAACLGPATADAHLPEGSAPRLEASLTYQGVPAAAFVFDQASQHEVVVVDSLGCGLLADLEF